MKIPQAKSEGEETLALHLNADGYTFEREWRFDPSRKWRFDFFIERGLKSVAVEVEGGYFGRHQRHEGFEKDCEKYAAAACQGHHVLRFTTAMVKDGRAIDTINRFFETNR